jgi:hypothetical protein
MRNSKAVLAVLVATAAVAVNAAEARHYRHAAYSDYVVNASDCTIVPPSITAYIYPTANWEPFFRRHIYRYGPILACAPSSATTNLVSVRY